MKLREGRGGEGRGGKEGVKEEGRIGEGDREREERSEVERESVRVCREEGTTILYNKPCVNLQTSHFPKPFRPLILVTPTCSSSLSLESRG